MVEAAIRFRLQATVDNPRNSVKVIAARIGIDRVTLWRVLSGGHASARTIRLITAFDATTATPKRI
jgi:hypothetical protein